MPPFSIGYARLVDNALSPFTGEGPFSMYGVLRPRTLGFAVLIMNFLLTFTFSIDFLFFMCYSLYSPLLLLKGGAFMTCVLFSSCLSCVHLIGYTAISDLVILFHKSLYA